MSADARVPTGPPVPGPPSATRTVATRTVATRTVARRTVARRTFSRAAGGLLASTTLLAAGCDSAEPLDLPGLPPLGGEEPDLEQVRAALRSEQLLLEQVSKVRKRHRVLRQELAPTVAVHRAHVALLSRAVDEPDSAEPDSAEPDSAATDGTDDGAGARRTGDRVARRPAAAVAELIRLERSLADEHVETAMRSRSGVLARAVAAMSAAAAQQAVALAPLAVRRGDR